MSKIMNLLCLQKKNLTQKLFVYDGTTVNIAKDPNNKETYIDIEPVRKGRADKRKLRAKSVVNFIYRVA